ncbi:MAG: hypothetical protein ACOY93_06900 [Bacillota bacterium]
MRLRTGLVAAALLIQLCALADPNPLRSAAQPSSPAGAAETGQLRRGLELVRREIARRFGAEELLPDQPWELSLDEAGVGVQCLPAEASESVVLCQYGPEAGAPLWQGIFWREQGSWLAQLYPEPPASLAHERMQFLGSLGCKACSGRLRQVRWGEDGQGWELLVVHDRGTEAAPMEEVHLLRLFSREWRTLWAPGPGDWNWGHARVTLLGAGLDGFSVRSSSWSRQDRFAGYLAEPPDGEHRWFQERWVRRGPAYILRDQVEEPGAYGALVRLIYYLSHRYDQRAEGLLGPEIGLEEARTALAQQPPRQGWGVERVEPGTFRLDRDGDGQPDLEAVFTQLSEGWALTGLGAPANAGER